MACALTLRLNPLTKEDDLDIISDKDLADYRWMSRFVHETANILTMVHDILKPHNIEAFLEYGFDDPPQP